jgi:hypothetical protein
VHVITPSAVGPGGLRLLQLGGLRLLVLDQLLLDGFGLRLHVLGATSAAVPRVCAWTMNSVSWKGLTSSSVRSWPTLNGVSMTFSSRSR